LKKLKDIRKAEIMEQFYKVVNQHGFSGTTLAKVAESIGMNPSLLLHYYKSKEEMIVEFSGFIIQKYEYFYFKPLETMTDPKERFEHLLNTLLLDRGDSGHVDEHLVSDRAFYECYALSITHPRVKEKFQHFYGRFRKELTREIKALKKSGIIKAKNAELAAGFLIVLLEGKDIYWNMTEDDSVYVPLRKYLKEVAYRILADG
jgi:AcrR family transcriptional regulator